MTIMMTHEQYQKILDLWEKNPDDFREQLKADPIGTLANYEFELDEETKAFIQNIQWGDEDFGSVLHERISKKKL